MKKTIYTLFTAILSTFVWAGPADSEMDKMVDQYFKIQSALAQDSTKGIDAAAAQIVTVVMAAKTSDPQTQKILGEIKKAAQDIQGKNLDQARSKFSELSRPILEYLKRSSCNC